MIYRMYSIKDERNGFGCPVPMTNELDAERNFKNEAINSAMIKSDPQDFSCYYMGTFDTESGTFIQDPQRDIVLKWKAGDFIGDSNKA